MSLTIDTPRPVKARAEVDVARIDAEEQRRLNAPSIALLEAWLRRSEHPATPEQIADAEADLTDFMRNMNAPRREAGERLHFPDASAD
ncbi:MAG: hypothetical protein M3Y28_07075 [Armatimonadota bacterium]|nr:hypothetical protein [Armatimonadota bacterium]